MDKDRSIVILDGARRTPRADILVNNNSGPPPGAFQSWGESEWQAALTANMLAPVFMIQGLIEGMKARRFGRIVNITSVAVKMPVGNLGLSNGARAGLTGFVAGIAREPAQHNVTINNLLPGYIATDRMWAVVENAAGAGGHDPEAFKQAMFARIGAKRPGDPDEFGAACAFLCSRQAAYITAQNLLVDGGLYPGTI